MDHPEHPPGAHRLLAVIRALSLWRTERKGVGLLASLPPEPVLAQA